MWKEFFMALQNFYNFSEKIKGEKPEGATSGFKKRATANIRKLNHWI
jgi:hypothetical protein